MWQMTRAKPAQTIAVADISINIEINKSNNHIIKSVHKSNRSIYLPFKFWPLSPEFKHQNPIEH